MARIRTVKPEFFLHEELYDLEVETELPIRIAFVGLWCQADREGRFRWRPRTLKAGILPHDDLDFSRVLHALTTRGFILRYASDGEEFGFIPTFPKHQIINNRESPSDLPDPRASSSDIDTSTRGARVGHAWGTRDAHAQGEGKGREGKGKEGERKGKDDSSEPQAASEQADPPVMLFDIVGSPDDPTWPLPSSKVIEWEKAFPGVNVLAECLKARQWCIDNPSKRKTGRGMTRFLFSWLERSQNSGRGRRNDPPEEEAII